MAACLLSMAVQRLGASSNTTACPITNFQDVLADDAVLMVAGLVPSLRALVILLENVKFKNALT